MARLTGPLFSLGASGTIAKTLTFATWKGIPYARTRVIPYNPKSTKQQEVRGIFSTLNEMWKRMPTNARGPFIHAVRGLALTDRNRHIQVNVKPLIDQSDLNNLVMSVAGGSATIPDNVVVNVATPFHIIVTADAPTAPPGYTFHYLLVVAVPDADPSPVKYLTTYADTDSETPYSVDLTVPTAVVHQVAVIGIWDRDADGRVFYSAAVRSQETVVAV